MELEEPLHRTGVEDLLHRLFSSYNSVFICMSEEILNITARDPFLDASEETHDQSKVHIRVQQRNGRKCITTVAGLAEDLDVKKILKAFKKNFSCNGAIAKDPEVGLVIQLSGDQRANVKDFLVDEEICGDGQIVVHGF